MEGIDEKLEKLRAKIEAKRDELNEIRCKYVSELKTERFGADIPFHLSPECAGCLVGFQCSVRFPEVRSEIPVDFGIASFLHYARENHSLETATAVFVRGAQIEQYRVSLLRSGGDGVWVSPGAGYLVRTVRPEAISGLEDFSGWYAAGAVLSFPLVKGWGYSREGVIPGFWDRFDQICNWNDWRTIRRPKHATRFGERSTRIEPPIR